VLADPKSTNKTHNLTVFFALLGSTHVKAAYRMLMKLIPDQFPTCLLKAFMHTDPQSIRIQSSRQYLFARLGSGCIKAASKMLVKLSPDGSISPTLLLKSQICLHL